MESQPAAVHILVLSVAVEGGAVTADVLGEDVDALSEVAGSSKLGNGLLIGGGASDDSK